MKHPPEAPTCYLQPNPIEHGATMSQYRKGFVICMWTGLFPINDRGRPVIFSSVVSAEKTLARYPSWGHAAVEIRHVRTRPGSNGKPDYLIGEVAS